jgi:hypothetical protein
LSRAKAKSAMPDDEFLDSCERQWRARAELVSLAAETLDEIAIERREEALAEIGERFARLWPGMAAQNLLRRWPAVQVLATAGVAAEHYARGTFWPKLARILNVNNTAQFQTAWGEAFLDNLQKLGLPTFDNDDDTGSRYVGKILLHCGMPTYCLADFFKILSRKRSSGLSPEAFVSWAASAAAESALFDIDKPVRRFLRFGGEFAIDVADRSYEVLDVVRAGGASDDGLLPKRFWSEAEKFIEGGNDPGPSPGPGGPSNVRPRLVLDPFGQGLILRLPPVGDAPDGRAVWVVSFDGDIQRVTTESLWPGSTEPAPQTDVAITKPVRTASVALAGREHLQLPMMVIDDRAPLLAFGEDGEFIPPTVPMPAARTWLLFPGDPDALQATGSINVVTESPLPPGWSGFCLVQVDLSDTTEVSLDGASRSVRKFEAARIEVGNPVHGVRTTSGLPVFAELPHVVLPAGMAAADWDVALHDGEGAVVSHKKVTGTDNADGIWDDVPRPLVGTYAIRVRGPWGRGAARSLAIVEGLAITFTPNWRRFITGGLQPCVARVRVSDDVRLSAAELDFAERDREHTLRVSSHSNSLSLVVSPPHMTVAYQSVRSSISPSVRPLSLTREDVIDSPGELVLDVGAAAEPVLHVIARSQSAQTVASRLGRAGVYRFDLAQIADTLRDQPQVTLALNADGELAIATVRPQALFRGIQLDGGELRFGDCVDIDGLTAYVFALRAPWRQPTPIPIKEGHAQLPGWLAEAGPLGVVARIEDPWIPLPPPGWLQAGGSTLVEAEGWVIDEDDEEQALSRFLAGFTPLPTELRDLTRLWTARALLPRLGLGPRINQVANDIDDTIYAHPAAALASLSESEVPIGLIPSLMVRSGLAWANLADAHESTAPPWTLRGALPAALLSAADSLWSEDEIEAAITICGDSVNGVLDGNDPHAKSGCLDEAADVFDSNPDLREQWVRAAGLVPKGLLSADSRVLAAMEFVANRRNPWLQWLVTNAHNVLRESERLIRMIGDTSTQAAFSSRVHPMRNRGWHIVPAISISYALAARHASRGHPEAGRWIVKQQRPWADLAEVAPQLVTIDLIIGELTVARRAEELEGRDDDEQS